MATSRFHPSSEAMLEDGLRTVRDAEREAEGAEAPEVPEDKMSDEYLLGVAADIERHSKDWFETSIRTRVIANYDLFHSQHPPGSKYRTSWYDKRSKVFRPKIRANINKLTAACAVALFSTADVLHCQAENPKDPAQRLAADISQALLQYRLESSVPWYKIVVAAVQEAAVTGVVISKQEWRYREVEYRSEVERQDEVGNLVALDSFREREVKEDTPAIKLLPIENFGIDPACDWLDPVNSSPYTVEYQPVYVGELLERINDPNQLPRYRPVSRDELRKGVRDSYESVRRAREGRGRQDRYEDTQHRLSEFDTVWVHHHIVRIDGQDYVYDTLGAVMMLSDVVPIEDVYPTAERPYVMGSMLIEAHKHYPDAPADLIRPIQEEVNDLANLRLDNVKLALNKRYFVRRGQVSDVRALLRNVPGGLVWMNDPERDIKVHETKEVTKSSYEEADRLNMEIDELTGSFTQTSILNHRKQMETVGGMNLLAEGASQVSELMVRTFAETWVEPVLKQLMVLEHALESDEKVMALVAAGQEADLPTVFQALDSPINVRVNVGFGATNPVKRVEKLAVGMKTLGDLFPESLAQADQKEVVAELFGALGYADGSRFFPNIGQENPQVAQLQQRIQELEMAIQTKQVESQAKMQIEQLKGEVKERVEQIKIMAKRDEEAAKREFEAQRFEWERQLEQFEAEIKMADSEIKKRELWMQREALSHAISMAERQFALSLQTAQLAAPPRPEDTGEPAESEQLVESLRSPPSGTPLAQAPDLPGDDKAGTIQRGQYGMIPGKSG